MPYTLKDLQHLEIMARLENFVPPKPNVSDLLNSINNKELTLNEKILVLCNKLRLEGFDKQASDLEDKFIFYKSAASHLYRAIDEDGEDLINSAHPDGEVKLKNTNNDFDVVETILTKHKKIVDVVNKTPVGKLGSINKKADNLITISDIAKKFQYFADYLDKHVLAGMPGSNKSPQDIKYYNTANSFYELGLTIARDLNKQEQVPESEAVRLVKNRMFNAQLGMQVLGTFKNIADIDKYINDTLSWFEDYKPLGNKEKISKYIEHCKNILKNADVIDYISGVGSALPLTSYLYKGWESFKEAFGNIADQSELLKSSLETLLADNNASKYKDLTNQIEKIIPILDKVIIISPKISELEVSPQGKTKIISAYKRDFGVLQENLTILKNIVIKVENIADSAVNKLYHLIVGSNLLDTRLKIVELNKSLSNLLIKLNSIEGESVKTQDKENNKLQNLFSDSGSNDYSVVANSEITKLQSWKDQLNSKNMDKDHKQHIINWIDGQIKSLKEVTTLDQVNEIIGQNKRFESKGLI